MAHKKTIKKVNKKFSIKEFYQKRKKILIMREMGGVGDILMHSMMFEDFKLIFPDCHLAFACPKVYLPLLENHPYLDEALDYMHVDTNEYAIVYNTTSSCGRYEESIAPFSDKHRSDIWAESCGVKLKNHNMHLNISDDLKEFAKQKLSFNNKPKVAVCPISAMVSKNLLTWQSKFILNYLEQKGLSPFLLHKEEISDLKDYKGFFDLNIKQWAALISEADYVITVDSAAFHLAGGLKKPLMGIFTWADGKVYGKYFDFILVQKHRDNGDWDCGPCYRWHACPKSKKSPKPCLTLINEEMLKNGLENLLKKWPVN